MTRKADENEHLHARPNSGGASAHRLLLDGSQSSDADNDPLTYLWLSTISPQPSTPFAAGALATNQFAVGPHTVQLVVSDGHDTATAQVSFEVITPATAVGQLVQLVDNAELGTRNKQPLLATLLAAMSSFDRGDMVAGLNQLSAFQNQVRAQVAPLNPSLADELSTATQQIITAVRGM